MKFLEYTPLSRVSSFLGQLHNGDYLLQGILEAYSCKLAGPDKKLSRSLEQEVVDSLAASPQDLATSPLGPLTNSASRRTLIYLILTLNHIYPDYDFSTLRAHHFTKEDTLSVIQEKIDVFLVEASKIWEQQRGEDRPMREILWNAIDEVMDIVDCEVYSYKPDVDGGPFMDKNSIWAFNYFFYNKNLRRVLYFSCRCVSRQGLDESSSEGMQSDDEIDFAPDMDLE